MAGINGSFDGIYKKRLRIREFGPAHPSVLQFAVHQRHFEQNSLAGKQQIYSVPILAPAAIAPHIVAYRERAAGAGRATRVSLIAEPEFLAILALRRD